MSAGQPAKQVSVFFNIMSETSTIRRKIYSFLRSTFNRSITKCRQNQEN
jgi:hypothetical protein